MGTSRLQKKGIEDMKKSFSSVEHKSYFDLNGKEKKFIEELIREKKIKCLSYSLNPEFLNKIQPNLFNYIMFIDARRADYYFKIKQYIEERRDQFNSYLTTGDADFIISYSATKTNHHIIKKEVSQILDKIPVETQDALVQCFQVSKQLILKGKTCSTDYNETEELTFDEKIKISASLCNYYSEKVVKRFRSIKAVKDFLKKLEKNDILETYYTIGGFPEKIKAIVLILYTDVGYEKIFKTNKEIAKNIVDLYELSGENIVDPFFKRANYAIFGEFQNMAQYHEWKEKVYNSSIQNSQLINFMTYVVEDTISEIPQTIGDLKGFEELCESYFKSKGQRIFVGNPYYYDEVEENKSIYLNPDYLKEQGLIIGYMNSGKTYSAIELSKRYVKEGLRVHFLDCTGGLTGKIKKEFPEIMEQALFSEVSIDKDQQGDLANNSGLTVYNIPEAEYFSFVKKLLNKIQEKPDSTGRKTTDMVIFEEAHKLFKDKETVDKLFTTIKFVGRKGLSLWFSTQRFSDFPYDASGVNFAKDLKNRIIHKIDESEANSIADFLCPDDKTNTYLLVEELKKLIPGQAIVSFYNEDTQLKPVKVSVKKLI